MAQNQPGQHDNARRQQRRHHNQDHHPGFTRLHGVHFGFAPRVAPRLKRLHIVIKPLRHWHQGVLQQIVVAIRALVVQGFQHRVDPLLVIGRKARRDLVQQLLPLRIRHAAVNNGFQRFLGLYDFLLNVLHRVCRVVEHADFHHADGLARFIARAQDQRVTRIKLHHLLTLKVVDALK